jgi:hypothetical protein
MTHCAPRFVDARPLCGRRHLRAHCRAYLCEAMSVFALCPSAVYVFCQCQLSCYRVLNGHYVENLRAWVVEILELALLGQTRTAPTICRKMRVVVRYILAILSLLETRQAARQAVG